MCIRDSHRDGAINAAIGHLVRHQFAGVFEGKGFDVDDPRRKPRSLDSRLALLDVLEMCIRDRSPASR